MLSPLLVESIYPINQTVEARLNTAIKLTFTKHVEESSLQGNIRLRKTNGNSVPMTLEYVHITKTCMVRYQGLLESNTEYTIDVIGGPNGVKGIDGGLMVSRSFQFRTIEAIVLTPPQIQSITQVGYFLAPSWLAPTVIEGSDKLSYEVKLSEQLDPGAPALWPDFGNQMIVATNTTAIPYQVEPEKQYYVHIRSLLEDEKSVWATETIFTERIDEQSPPDSGGGTETPTSSLTILDHNPVHQHIGVVDQIDLLFSEPITSTDLENLVYLVEKPHKIDLSKLDFIKGYGSNFKVSSTILHDGVNPDLISIIPTTPLSEDKDYTVIVKNGLEGQNNVLTTLFSFGFTTKVFNVYGDIANVKEMTSSVSMSVTDEFIKQLMSQYSAYAFEIWSNGNAFNPDLDNPSNVPFYVSRYVELKTAMNLVLTKSLSSSGKEVIKLSALTVESSGRSDSSGTLREMEREIEDLEKMMINGLTRKKRATPVFASPGSESLPYPDYMSSRGRTRDIGE